MVADFGRWDFQKATAVEVAQQLQTAAWSKWWQYPNYHIVGENYFTYDVISIVMI